MPVGLKIDSANNLYVTDAAAQVIVKITSDFKIASLAGTAITMGSTDGTGTVARFNEPTDLVINDDGSFLLTDTSNASLRKVTTAGVVTTFAGTSGSKGSTDGTGAAARFSAPVGITRDTAGNVYVADQTNHVIRRVTPAGVVTTLAGTAGTVGSTDGTGAAARFNLPTGVAINSTDLIYVADFGSHTLRKVTSSGVVTTFAGTAGTSGSVDGTGTAARFNKPSGLALDTAGNLYVADTGNSTVRKVSPAGVVTTLAGLSAITGLKDGTGTLAWFNEPEGVTSDTAGNLYVADTGNAVIRKVTPAGVVTTLALTGTAPVITAQPASVSVTTGNSASLSVTASGDGVLTYQWKKDGTDVAGATTAAYAISATSSSSAGSYTVVVSNFLGSVTSSAATLTVNAAPPPAPTPAPSSGGGGGGGGAPSYGFLALLALWAWRRRQSSVA
jgi:sugar lactone lactonase YvrE